MSIYDIEAASIDGQTQTLGDYRGQVLLIVNTASKCGFTPQYAGLEALHRKYKDRKFSILGFPCDQFGHQEPGDENEIKNFCSLTYDCLLYTSDAADDLTRCRSRWSPYH